MRDAYRVSPTSPAPSAGAGRFVTAMAGKLLRALRRRTAGRVSPPSTGVPARPGRVLPQCPGGSANRRARTAGALATLPLVLACLFAGAPDAGAQTVEILVSNSGQSSEDNDNYDLANQKAQSFTTGANPWGYRLTSITLPGFDFSDSNGNTVTLRRGDCTERALPNSMLTPQQMAIR